jgi:anaerobic selenocysteine-containing dehydrogenase
VWCRLIPEAQAMHLPFQIESGKPYPVRALVAFGLNHRMWPGSDWVAGQIQKLDFVVDVDLFQTDASRLADIVLPACSSFERSELKFYGSGELVWTEPAIAPLGQSRSDVDIICDLARRLTPEDELLTGGHEKCVDWVLAPSGLRVAELQKHPRGIAVADARKPAYRKYERGGFNTPSGKMEFASGVLAAAGIDPLPIFVEPKQSPLSAPPTAERYPLILTTGARLPMFIHSRMYRVDSLRALRPDPMADISPIDAANRGISQLDFVRLSTPRSAVIVKANITETVPPGVVNVYHGHPEADVNTLIDPDYLDPISGFPGFKSLLCQVTKVNDHPP